MSNRLDGRYCHRNAEKYHLNPINNYIPPVEMDSHFFDNVVDIIHHTKKLSPIKNHPLHKARYRNINAYFNVVFLFNILYNCLTKHPIYFSAALLYFISFFVLAKHWFIFYQLLSHFSNYKCTENIFRL